MNHQISLSLDLLENAASELRFRLTLNNRSDVRLLFPAPEIIGIRFRNMATSEECEWYTSLFVSVSCGEFALNVGESRHFDWRVRPCGVERPKDWSGDFNYYRWEVATPPGPYSVCYRWRMDENFFDGDSHCRLPDLQFAAEQQHAEVWLGEAVSNSIELVRNCA